MAINRVKTEELPLANEASLEDILYLLRNGTDMRITVSALLGGDAAPITTAANVGGGAEVFQQVAGTTLLLRTLADGGGISWSEDGDVITGTLGNIAFTSLSPGTPDALLARGSDGSAAERFIDNYTETTQPLSATTYLLVDETAGGRHRKMSVQNLNTTILDPVTLTGPGPHPVQDSYHNRPVILTGNGATVSLPDAVTSGMVGFLHNASGGSISLTAEGTLLGDTSFGNNQFATVFKRSATTWVAQVSS